MLCMQQFIPECRLSVISGVTDIHKRRLQESIATERLILISARNLNQVIVFVETMLYNNYMVTMSATLYQFKVINLTTEKVVKTITNSNKQTDIHANSACMRQWLWKDVLNVPNHFYSNHFILYAILSVLLVFTICTILDQIRIRFIEKYIFLYIDKLIEKKENNDIKVH